MRLASTDVKTQRRGVVVLEELEVQATSGGNLERDSGASGAGIHAKGVGRATLELVDGADLLGDSGGVRVGGRLVSNTVQDSDGETTLVVEGVAGGLELVKLREEEDGRASLASVRGRDVEVEDGRNLGTDGAVVLSTVGLARVAGVNRDDQVGVLVSTVDVGRASGCGGSTAGNDGRGSSGCDAGLGRDGGRHAGGGALRNSGTAVGNGDQGGGEDGDGLAIVSNRGGSLGGDGNDCGTSGRATGRANGKRRCNDGACGRCGGRNSGRNRGGSRGN